MGNEISCAITATTTSAQHRKGIDRIASSLALEASFAADIRSLCGDYNSFELRCQPEKNWGYNFRYFSYSA